MTLDQHAVLEEAIYLAGWRGYDTVADGNTLYVYDSESGAEIAQYPTLAWAAACERIARALPGRMDPDAHAVRLMRAIMRESRLFARALSTQVAPVAKKALR